MTLGIAHKESTMKLKAPGYALKNEEGQFLTTDKGVYLIGGNYDPEKEKDYILFRRFKKDGTVGVWKKIGFFQERYQHSGVIFHNNCIYFVGGITISLGSVINTHIAVLKENGEIKGWADGPDLPKPLAGVTPFIYGGFLYLFGGTTVEIENRRVILEERNYDVYRSRINKNNSLNGWEYCGEIEHHVYNSKAVSNGEKLFLLFDATETLYEEDFGCIEILLESLGTGEIKANNYDRRFFTKIFVNN